MRHGKAAPAPLIIFSLLAGLLLSLADSLRAQQPKRAVATAKLRGKYGCIDTGGRIVVPIVYDDITFWQEGLIAVNIGARIPKNEYMPQGGKWGFCDRYGHVVVQPAFDEVQAYSEGLAAVRVGKAWGYIDTAGKMTIQPRFGDVRSFFEGLSAAKEGKQWGWINRFGQWAIAPTYAYASHFSGGLASYFEGVMPDAGDEYGEAQGLYGLIDRNGRKRSPAQYKILWPLKCGRARVEIVNSDDSFRTRTGFVDSLGRSVIPPTLDEAEDFHEGFAAVSTAPDTALSTKYIHSWLYGYIDLQGRPRTPMIYNYAEAFHQGVAVVGTGNGGFRSAFVFNTADYAILDYERNPVYGLIDTGGKLLLDLKWGALRTLSNGHVIAQPQKYLLHGVITRSGDTVIPFRYPTLEYAGNGLYVANHGDSRDAQIELLDERGKRLYEGGRFAVPEPRYEFGVMTVRTKNYTRSGAIDKNGRFVIPDIYEMLGEFELL